MTEDFWCRAIFVLIPSTTISRERIASHDRGRARISVRDDLRNQRDQ
ncbi:MAG: hypothetical protein R3E77_03260 [Steroidobacteraceae bacterium]